jgi:hypothetical protein
LSAVGGHADDDPIRRMSRDTTASSPRLPLEEIQHSVRDPTSPLRCIAR